MIQPGLPGTPAPPRPTRADPAILRAAAATIVAELDRALPTAEKMSVDDKAALAGWLAEEAEFETDGYRLARSLEQSRFAWIPDAEIVETLHGIIDEIDDLEEQAILDWVIAYRITPPLPDGVQVILTEPYASIPAETVFTIRKADIERATYTIYAPALNHLSDDDIANRRPGSWGIVVPYERVTLTRTENTC